MKAMYKSSLTIMFENPFWIGLYERFDNGNYEVCKITFGAEPKDYEIYDYLLQNWHKLKFSPPIKTDKIKDRKINPKRMQREINSQLEDKGIGTKAQQAFLLVVLYTWLEHGCAGDCMYHYRSNRLCIPRYIGFRYLHCRCSS